MIFRAYLKVATFINDFKNLTVTNHGVAIRDISGADIGRFKEDDANLVRHGIFYTLSTMWLHKYHIREQTKNLHLYDPIIKDVLSNVATGFIGMTQKHNIAVDIFFNKNKENENRTSKQKTGTKKGGSNKNNKKKKNDIENKERKNDTRKDGKDDERKNNEEGNDNEKDGEKDDDKDKRDRDNKENEDSEATETVVEDEDGDDSENNSDSAPKQHCSKGRNNAIMESSDEESQDVDVDWP